MLTSIRNSAVLAVALSVLMLLPTAYYWPIQDTFHSMNFDWNGCSTLAASASTSLISSYSTPITNSSSLLAIIGPEVEFTNKESAVIREFLDDGGNVLLADDFGSGNGLLQELNVSARFADEPIADLLYYSKNPDFPIIVDFTPSPLTLNLTSVIMNKPSYLNLKDSTHAMVLASSSPFSFIDAKGDGIPESNITIHAYPVMSVLAISKRGTLILIADSGMFTNEMVNLFDNMQLFRNILRMAGGKLLFDVAHLRKAPLTDLRLDFRELVGSLGPMATARSMYAQVFVFAVILLSFCFAVILRLRKARRQLKLKLNLG